MKFLQTLRTGQGPEDRSRLQDAPSGAADTSPELWEKELFVASMDAKKDNKELETIASGASAMTRPLAFCGAAASAAGSADAASLGPLLESMAGMLKMPGPDLSTPGRVSLGHIGRDVPKVKAKPLDTEQPTFEELPCWLIDCTKRVPGSRPIQGALELSITDVDGLLQGAFAREERDFSSVSRGAGGLADPRRSALTAETLSTAKAVVRGRRRSPGIPITRDTILLALVLMARYIGEVEGDAGEPSSEDSLLPAVCLNMAYKMDESLACNLLRSLLLIVTPRIEDGNLPVQKAMAQLESKIFTKLDFMLRSETPYTFLHHFLARVLALRCLVQEEIANIGRAAAQTAFTWTTKGLLASFKPSEVAAVALDCAVRKLVSDEAAIGVARAVRCPLWSPRFSPMYEENGLPRPPALEPDAKFDARVAKLTEEAEDEGVGCDDDGGGGKMPAGDDVKSRGPVSSEEYDTEDVTPPVTADGASSNGKTFFPEDEVDLKKIATTKKATAFMREGNDEPHQSDTVITATIDAHEIGDACVGRIIKSPSSHNDERHGHEASTSLSAVDAKKIVEDSCGNREPRDALQVACAALPLGAGLGTRTCRPSQDSNAASSPSVPRDALAVSGKLKSLSDGRSSAIVLRDSSPSSLTVISGSLMSHKRSGFFPTIAMSSAAAHALVHGSTTNGQNDLSSAMASTLGTRTAGRQEHPLATRGTEQQQGPERLSGGERRQDARCNNDLKRKVSRAESKVGEPRHKAASGGNRAFFAKIIVRFARTFGQPGTDACKREGGEVQRTGTGKTHANRSKRGSGLLCKKDAACTGPGRRGGSSAPQVVAALPMLPLAFENMVELGVHKRGAKQYLILAPIATVMV